MASRRCVMDVVDGIRCSNYSQSGAYCQPHADLVEKSARERDAVRESYEIQRTIDCPDCGYEITVVFS